MPVSSSMRSSMASKLILFLLRIRTTTKFEQMVLGLMIGIATDLEFELCHAHEKGRAWGLWCAIKDSHVI